ncbi:MAG: family 10 glycosylhydrolase [Prevotella sp.]|nr:family 10 glycosylhydrolase [Prevotella sp.]
MRHLLFFYTLLIFFFTLPLSAQDNAHLFPAPSYVESLMPQNPKYEVRAVWLTTISGLDWPSVYAKSENTVRKQQKDLCDILDRLQQAGINTVLLQTRVRATTIYPSQYEPWDACLTGTATKSPGYDPLAFAIEECHKRGMELHAWVVTIPVGKWSSAGCTRIRKKYPSLIKKIGDEGYMNPEMAQTSRYLADICDEIASNYDVDGIHLDYIRYPETWKIKVSKAQGRRNITAIVTAISQRVKARKPWIKMSCSPIGKHDDLSRYRSGGWNARTTVCQDAQEWLRTGLMDQLYPMMYFQGNNFYPFAIDWKENCFGRMVVPGLGIYFMSPKEKNWPLETITREMQVLRQLDMGHAYFRSRFFTDNTKGLFDFARHRFDNTPALIPPMKWMHDKAPGEPQQLNIDEERSLLSWTKATDYSDAPYLLYNVYASQEWPVDVESPNHLMAARLRQTSAKIPLAMKKGNGAQPVYYAVTAVDRYGNESKPAQSHHFDAPKRTADIPQGLLNCDGSRLQLPRIDPQIDAPLVVIATMQGKPVKTIRKSEATVDVKNLPEGIYQLRSLNRKGTTHRLGFFMIRRR